MGSRILIWLILLLYSFKWVYLIHMNRLLLMDCWLPQLLLPVAMARNPSGFLAGDFAGIPAMLFSMHLTQKKWLEIAAAGPLILLPMVCLLWLTIMAPQATQHLVWLFATLWALDGTAFDVSRLCRGPKLAPKLIATRTWAGTITGAAAASRDTGVAAYTKSLLAGYCLWCFLNFGRFGG